MHLPEDMRQHLHKTYASMINILENGVANIEVLQCKYISRDFKITNSDKSFSLSVSNRIQILQSEVKIENKFI